MAAQDLPVGDVATVSADIGLIPASGYPAFIDARIKLKQIEGRMTMSDTDAATVRALAERAQSLRAALSDPEAVLEQLNDVAQDVGIPRGCKLIRRLAGLK